MMPILILVGLFTIGVVGVRYAYTPEMRKHFGLGLWLTVAAALLTGFLLGQVLLFLAVVFLGVVLTTFDRVGALARFVIVSAVLPSIKFIVMAGGAYVGDLSMVDVLLFATVAVLLMHGRRQRSSVRGFIAPDALALTVVLIFGVAILRETSPTALPRMLVAAAIGLALPYYVVSRAVRSPDDLRHIAAAWAGAAIILAVISLYEATYGWSLYEGVRQRLGQMGVMSLNLRVRAGFLRSPTAFPDSTSFAVFQAIGVVAAVTSRAAFRSRTLWLGGVALTVLGLLAAQSRGADLGLLAGAAAILLFRRKTGRVVAFAFIAGLSVGALRLAAESSQRVAAFIGADRSYQGFSDYRGLLFKRGVEEGLKNPILGDDLPSVIGRMPDLVQGEKIVDLVNSYLTIFLASGFIGLLAFMLLLAVIMGRLWAAARPGRIEPGRPALLLFTGGGLAAMAVTILFTSFEDRTPLWFLLLLACSRPLLAGAGAWRKAATPVGSPFHAGAAGRAPIASSHG